MRVPVRCIPHSVITRSLSLLQDKTDATKRFVIKQARTRLCYCAHCDEIAAVAIAAVPIAAVAISAVAISAVAIAAVATAAVAIAAVALASHTLTRSPRARIRPQVDVTRLKPREKQEAKREIKLLASFHHPNIVRKPSSRNPKPKPQTPMAELNARTPSWR